LRTLLTHTSRLGPDATQEDIFGVALKSQKAISGLVDDLKTRPLRAEAEAAFFYNNENYLLLERLLRARLGEDPVAWCLENVPALAAMDSLGPSARAPALNLAGGLEASARDLAMFFHQLRIAPNWPVTALDARNSYGPGVSIQTIGHGANLFHLGGICPVLLQNSGAFAVRLEGGTSAVALYSNCADDAALGALNEIMLGFRKPE